MLYLKKYYPRVPRILSIILLPDIFAKTSATKWPIAIINS